MSLPCGGEGFEDAGQDGGGGWRAAGDGVVDRDDGGDGAAGGVVGAIAAEDSSAGGTVAEGDDEFGVGDGVVGAAKGFFHVDGDRAGDEQEVGVARAGNELDRKSVA